MAPALALLVPALTTPDAVLGHPERGIYPTLHAASVAARGTDLLLGYPGDLPEIPLDPLLATILGMAPSLAPASIVNVAALGAVAVGAWLYQRWAVLLGHAPESWSIAALLAVGVAGPGILHAWLDGAPAAGQGWALVAVPVAAACGRSGPAAWVRALITGLGVGALAAPLVPAAVVVALVTCRPDVDAAGSEVAASRSRAAALAPALAGLVLAAGVALALGARPDLASVGLSELLHGGRASPGAPAPVRAFVGGVALVAALAGLASRAGRTAGAAALVCAVAVCVPGGLLLVPGVSILASMAALATLRARVGTESAGAVAVLVAAIALADGARGVGLHGTLPSATLAVPDPVRRLAAGPVLDLPLAPGKLRARLQWQLAHERPVAFDAAGLVTPKVLALAEALASERSPTSPCPSPRAQGFRSLVVRREAEFRDLSALISCFGTPTVVTDDLAVWDLATVN